MVYSRVGVYTFLNYNHSKSQTRFLGCRRLGAVQCVPDVRPWSKGTLGGGTGLCTLVPLDFRVERLRTFLPRRYWPRGVRGRV